MLEKLWAFFFGGEVEQQVVVVNAATLQDAYEFRRRLYADIGDEVPTRIQVEEALGDGEAGNRHQVSAFKVTLKAPDSLHGPMSWLTAPVAPAD